MKFGEHTIKSITNTIYMLMAFNFISLAKTSFLKWNYPYISNLACLKWTDNTNPLSQTVPLHSCRLQQWHLFHLLSSETSESSLILPSLTPTPYPICKKALLTLASKYIQKMASSHHLYYFTSLSTWVSDLTPFILTLWQSAFWIS